MPNTVYEIDEEDDAKFEKDEENDQTDERDEKKDVKDEKKDVKDEKEKKLHTTPNSDAVRRGCNRWRADRQQQTPATLAIIYMLYYTEIQL